MLVGLPAWVLLSPVPNSGCVTAGDSLSLAEPPFPHQQNGNNDLLRTDMAD